MRRIFWVYGACTVLALAIFLLFRRSFLAVGKILLAAGVLAGVLLPLCKKMERYLPRTAAALSCIAGLIGALVLISALCVPIFGAQLRELKAALPNWLDAVRALAEDLTAQLALDDIDLAPAFGAEGFLGLLGSQIGRWTGFAVGKAAGVGQYLISPVLAFYLLRDREKLADWFVRILPPAWREGWTCFFADFSGAFGDYLRAQLGVCLFTGVLTALFLFLLGLDAALLLGLLMAIFNIIPYFGPVLGAVPILMAALPGGWMQVLWALFGVIGVQQIESIAVTPHLMGRACGFHPAFIMLLIVFCAGAFGLWGMILAVPMATFFRCAARCYVFRKIYGKKV